MASFALNIPEAFRTSCQLSRSGYQPIDDQSDEAETTKYTKCELATILVGSSIVFTGFVFLYVGFIIPGLVMVLTIPLLCCLYSQLYDLDARECCLCLKGICCCCFKLFDLQATSGLPNHEPYVFDPQNVEIGSRDSPPAQIVFSSEPSPIAEAVKLHLALTRQVHADDLTPATIISQKTNPRPQTLELSIPAPSKLVPMNLEESIVDSFETAASVLESFETVASSLGSVETSFISHNRDHSTTPWNEESMFKTIKLKETPVSPAMDVLTFESLTGEKGVYGTTAGKHELGTLPKEPVPEPLNVQELDPKPFNAGEPTMKTVDTKKPADTVEGVPILVDTEEPTLQSANMEKLDYNQESVPLPDDGAQSAPPL